MATPKQIAANRANAKKSTGPNTEAGKARSSGNSLKHGLTAESVVILGERAEDFDEFRGELLNEFDPQSTWEAELVAAVAAKAWRLRRAARFEAAILAARNADVAAPRHDQEGVDSIQLGDALISDARDGDALARLARHEARLTRDLEKTLKMLWECRDRRLEEAYAAGTEGDHELLAA